MIIKDDENDEVSELFREWGEYIRSEPGINLGVRLQQLKNGAPPKRYTSIPSFFDERLQWVDWAISTLCDELTNICLLLKYVRGKSNTEGALILNLTLSTYKRKIADAKVEIRGAIKYRTAEGEQLAIG